MHISTNRLLIFGKPVNPSSLVLGETKRTFTAAILFIIIISISTQKQALQRFVLEALTTTLTIQLAIRGGKKSGV